MDSAAQVNVSGTGAAAGDPDGVTGMPRLTLRTADGREVVAPPESLQRLPDGTYRLSLGGTDIGELSDTLRGAGGGLDQARAAAVIPVVAEELQVGRRTVETGRVRVTKLVKEHEEVVNEPIRTEEVVVERFPVNRVVDAAPEPRREGDTLVFPVLEEVLVVERRLMLKEEVRISKRITETQEQQTVTLREEDVRIERMPGRSDGEGT